MGNLKLVAKKYNLLNRNNVYYGDICSYHVNITKSLMDTIILINAKINEENFELLKKFFIDNKRKYSIVHCIINKKYINLKVSPFARKIDFIIEEIINFLKANNIVPSHCFVCQDNNHTSIQNIQGYYVNLCNNCFDKYDNKSSDLFCIPNNKSKIVFSVLITSLVLTLFMFLFTTYDVVLFFIFTIVIASAYKLILSGVFKINKSTILHLLLSIGTPFLMVLSILTRYYVDASIYLDSVGIKMNFWAVVPQYLRAYNLTNDFIFNICMCLFIGLSMGICFVLLNLNKNIETDNIYKEYGYYVQVINKNFDKTVLIQTHIDLQQKKKLVEFFRSNRDKLELLCYDIFSIGVNFRFNLFISKNKMAESITKICKQLSLINCLSDACPRCGNRKSIKKIVQNDLYKIKVCSDCYENNEIKEIRLFPTNVDIKSMIIGFIYSLIYAALIVFLLKDLSLFVIVFIPIILDTTYKKKTKNPKTSFRFIYLFVSNILINVIWYLLLVLFNGESTIVSLRFVIIFPLICNVIYYVVLKDRMKSLSNVL